MGFIRKQLLKVIEWTDDSHDTIVYRYPMTDRHEIMNGCQLIVRPSQVAILVSSGEIADIYTEGKHKLTTGNMPILTHLASWKYGFESPFKAEVYYVNTKQFINLKWGTTSKITLRDLDFGLVRIGARGVYSFKVKDVEVFLREIFGSNRDYSTHSLSEYFRSMVVSEFSDSIGEAKIPVVEMPGKYLELADIIKESITEKFTAIGLELCNFVVENVSLPEEVEKAIDQRATLGALSGSLNDFTQYQTAHAIREAANNPNGAGAFASAGVGLGAGMAIGNMMMNNATQPVNNNQAPVQSQQPALTSVCAKCGSAVAAGSKFCSNCGEPVAQNKFCTNCGHQIPTGAKFCSNCGKSQ